ncbi:MAG: ABC transporter ATP-binding protein, partial [Candidatus Rokuibacteriota bacterium]
MLELQHVTRRFGGHAAVHDVSLRVLAGSLTGLIGPNGAGKSTLFNLVAGALAPSAGRILLDGRRLDGEPPHRVLARGVARTFQVPRPFPAMTVLENVMLAAPRQLGERFWTNWTRPAAVAADERRHRERARALLDFLDLGAHESRPARVLSGGQRKLLELGRALMTEPRLLLLDEPSLGLAPIIVREIFRIIAEINQLGTTVLLVEQNTRQALALSRRGYVLENGRIALAGTGSELLDNEHVRRA